VDEIHLPFKSSDSAEPVEPSLSRKERAEKKPAMLVMTVWVVFMLVVKYFQ
jgi:hypothetical protein